MARLCCPRIAQCRLLNSSSTEFAGPKGRRREDQFQLCTPCFTIVRVRFSRQSRRFGATIVNRVRGGTVLSVVGILQLNGGLRLRTVEFRTLEPSPLSRGGKDGGTWPGTTLPGTKRVSGLNLGGASHCSPLVVRPLPLQNTPVLQARSGLLPCELWSSLTQAPQHLHNLSRLIHHRLSLD